MKSLENDLHHLPHVFPVWFEQKKKKTSTIFFSAHLSETVKVQHTTEESHFLTVFFFICILILQVGDYKFNTYTNACVSCLIFAMYVNIYFSVIFGELHVF